MWGVFAGIVIAWLGWRISFWIARPDLIRVKPYYFWRSLKLAELTKWLVVMIGWVVAFRLLPQPSWMPMIISFICSYFLVIIVYAWSLSRDWIIKQH